MGAKRHKEQGHDLSQNIGELETEACVKKLEENCAQIASNVTSAKFSVSTNTFFITLAIYAPEWVLITAEYTYST